MIKATKGHLLVAGIELRNPLHVARVRRWLERPPPAAALHWGEIAYGVAEDSCRRVHPDLLNPPCMVCTTGAMAALMVTIRELVTLLNAEGPAND